MKDDKKRERLAALLGLEEHLPTEPKPSQVRLQEDKSREAEAVVAYISRPQTFKQVECKQCGAVFKTDRANVSMCKDECRKHWLANIGIVWDPTKPPEERWDYKEPLTVPPPALVVADLAVEMLIANTPQSDPIAVGNELQLVDTSDVQHISDPPLSPIVFDL